MGDGRRRRAAFPVLWDHLVVEDAPAPADAIFCFGSRHHRVPERAAALYAAGLAPLVVVTGGAPGPGPSEAERFATALVAAGVPADRLVLETRARHTGENVELGMGALRRHLDPRRLLLVSWPLAARRCRATFHRHHPDVALLSAPALRRPGHRWRPTARRVRFALGELDRLDRYAALGLLTAQPCPPAVRWAAGVLSAHHPARPAVPPAGPGGEAQELSLLLGEG